MFPDSDTTYSFNVKLVASKSVAGDAPYNGDVMVNTTLSFTSQSTGRYSIRFVELDRDKNRFYSVGDTLNVNIIYISDYAVTLTFLFKDANGGYSNTAWLPKHYQPSTSSSGATVSESVSLTGISRNGRPAGSFCLMATIKDDSGATVLSVPFYFVIVE